MPAILELRSVSKQYGAARVVDGVSLAVEQGTLFSLLGPSGCGKTTTLRLVAGFESPDAGDIVLNGERINGLPPYRRNVSTVFQSYALFPHLSVQENIAFGLRQRGDRGDIDGKVRKAMEMVQLGGKEARKPAQLSGGEKQRVAIARSLVLAPDVLLLDEPMSALDPLLRKQVRTELRDLQRRTGTTFLLVTHDQEEALSMSDRMAVMNQGRIEQAGTPRELYLKPRTRFVADFLGAMNWIGGAGLRPESLRLTASDPPSGCASREVVVEQMMFLGNCVHVQCRLTEDGSSVVAEVAPHQTFAAGERLKVCWQRSDELELPPA